MGLPNFAVQHSSGPEQAFKGASSVIYNWAHESIGGCAHAIPVYVSTISAIILLARTLSSSPQTECLPHISSTNKRDRSFHAYFATHSEAHGGCAIFTMELLCFVSCLGLSCVSISRFITLMESPELACIAFMYATLLALFIVLHPRPSPTLSRHLTVVLISSWVVFFIRDVLPLMMYNRSPADPPYMLWELIGVLTFAAIVLPLITPRQYIPFDASDPKPPSPEQTATPLSLLLFNFLDATVWKAYHVSHIPLAGLPFLADSDHSKHLVRAAFPHLDPYNNSAENFERQDGASQPFLRLSPHRSIFGAVFTVFRKETIVVILLLLSNTAATLLSPYGLKKLLEYMGSGGEGAIVKPWVWIGSLFLAPFVATLLMQQYQTRVTRVTVQLEAILTQLILQHALRIRVVAEGVSETPSSTNPTTPASDRCEITSTSTPTQPSTPIPSVTAKAGKSLVGRMNNLISSDMQAISQGFKCLQILVTGPILILSSMGFLYTIMGWSALVGFAVMLLLTPLPTLFALRLQSTTREMARKSDDRVEAVTETMSVIRMIKMFGWERKMSAQINEKREVELIWVWWNKVYTFTNMNFHFFIPAITMCSTFLVYALGMKRTLDAATVFSSVALFDIVRQQTGRISLFVPMIIRGQVSLRRIGEFLEDTELLDKFSTDHGDLIGSSGASRDEIGFGAATFSWSNESAAGGATPSKCRFRLRIDDELVFKRGCINLIVGSTGSGKTSLLMALLGEMHFLPSGPGSWFNLPRGGGVAYAAQESWVINATIRENILFESPFDEERYKAVVYQCALTPDLELLSAGDSTEVGERGLTLSGGQKARLTLARAVYSSAEILLLDDVFAALDVHTSKWIVEQCLNGDLIRGRTVLLVAHNIGIVAPISDFMVRLGRDGQIVSQGAVSDALERDVNLKLEIAKGAYMEKKAVEELGTPKTGLQNGMEDKLILEEEVAEGHISFTSGMMYFVALGGRHWILFWCFLITAMFLASALETLQPWLLGAWATEYQERPAEEVNVAFYLTGYVALTSIKLLVFLGNQVTLTSGALRASALLHKQLIDTILGTTLRWLDKTPTSRVITRVTQDITAGNLVDSTIPEFLFHILEIGILNIVRLTSILSYTPKVGILGFVIFVIGGTVGNIYMKSQLSVKREMSKAKAPVIAHFGASIEGLISIRAYGAQATVLEKSLSKIDNYSRASITFNDLARWIGIRVDALGGWFAASLGWYYVYGPSTGISTSNSAFTLTMAVSFGRSVLGFVQMLNMFEINGNSLERLQEYMGIEQEPRPTNIQLPPAHWPSSGELHVEKLSARYSPDGPSVLHDISFDLKSGERVGVVGRTGSGKSSLTLSLLRCIFTDGEVYYDGLPTSTLNLDALRSQVTIIPQMPELLSGTLRRNLDPFDQFDDAVLYTALRDAGLYCTQKEDEDDKITLDSTISRGGSNLSVGQRQIIALARAMVRESKLLILDEATSAIDYKTDEVIQRSLRNELKKDVTIVTVAHRLKTIMDSDKIMVLDAGRIVEFDHPSQLLKKEGGFFRSLVNESGDKEALYAAVKM
ncbi:P-loop containing nucleoside triphosphate hydrolase protein [Collybia nuda]|uniref:P-loop containing nucleoside triphosphate hydrolase protein n=1 Tax=Collybia nuda TaxID=64659 RepID=A0A9P5Y5S2_9AGAR|nr:P-loop containing nucleoside triphosphate hydrolase protein [Collybia nuda]